MGLTIIPTGWYVKIMSENTQLPKPSTREKILDAALKVIRTKGYTATSVDDLCEEAQVTKGAFFHHFKSKEDLAISAVDYWSMVTNQLFSTADYSKHSDPLDRVLGYIDFRKEIIRGEIPEFTCFVGTLVQETFGSNPRIRQACEQSIFGHAAEIEKDIFQAKNKYAPDASWTTESVAMFTQAAIQGSYIVSKAKNDSKAAIDGLSHLRKYIEFLFNKKI